MGNVPTASRFAAETTGIIKTFERPEALHRLVASLKLRYPEMPILVLDDSFKEYPRPTGVNYLRTKPDIGASAGRNLLLQQVDTPYFWQLDDDFEATKQTLLDQLAGPVAEGKADLVAGDAVRCKRKWFGWIRHKASPFFGRIECANGVLRLTPGERARSGDYLVCDIAPQFFVGRTDRVREIGGWDADLKTEEHEEFFVRCQKHGLRVWYAPHVKIRHWSELPRHYAFYRGRSYRPLAAKKMNVHTWIDMDQSVTHYATRAAAA